MIKAERLFFVSFFALFSYNVLVAEGTSVLGEATGERYRFIDDVPFQNAADASGAVTRSYLYAGAEPVALTENGQTEYIGTDVRGSVRTLTDRYGRLSARSDYDAFGVPLSDDAVVRSGLGYTGKPFDFTTKLYNYGFRDYSPMTGRFTTVDPIRYGSNWYAYVNNDPLNYVDLWGLLNLKPIALKMQDDRWGKLSLGSSRKDKAELVGQSGCYLTGFASAASTLTGKEYTPLSFNSRTDLFTEDQLFDSTTAAKETGLVADYWTKAVQGDLTAKLNELDQSSTAYVVMAQVPYNKKGGLHWVEVYGSADDDGWISIVGTSEYDDNKYSERGELTDTWNFSDEVTKIKASEINQLRTFTVDKSK